MEKMCIRFIFIILILVFQLVSSLAQSGSIDQEEASIRQTALNYIEGYYSGDVDRIEKAIHPDINKATPRDIPQTGRTLIAYTTYSALVENTRAKTGVLADSARHIHIQVLNVDNGTSNVKVVSANFTDFLQMVKLDGQWKILNVIFTSGSAVAPRMKDFNPESEKGAIQKIATDYLAGFSGADAARIDKSICPEFNRVTLIPIAVTGKTSIRRQRYETMIENALAGIGKQDEVYKDYKTEIIDITDGLAIVKCELTNLYEYVQMYKSSGQWKILNSIVLQNQKLTLADAMTVTSGHSMPEFTLPVYGGGNFTLSKYLGKNVMLIFPRGYAGSAWCAYCPYQYLELEQLQKTSGIEEKYNMKIAFVLPYGSDRIKDWMEKFPSSLQVVEGIKNPQPAPAQGSIQDQYSAWARYNFPIKFEVKENDPHSTIPVLLDENRTLSKQLKVFTHFWDGVTSDQNIASVFIIDKNGTLKFKYIGQMTEDRPTTEFLLDIVKNMK